MQIPVRPATTVRLDVAAQALLKERASKKERWSVGGGSTNPPALVKGGVVHSEGHTVRQIDSQGHVVWSQDLAGEVSAPAACEQAAYVCTAGRLEALDRTGRPLWRASLPVEAESRPAVGPDGTVYVVDKQGVLHGFRADGSERFQRKVKTFFDWDPTPDLYTSPVIGPDGTVLVANSKKYLCAFRPDGKRAWKYRLPQQLMTEPSFDAEGNIVLGCFLLQVVKLNSRGRQVWKKDLDGPCVSFAAAGPDGTAYAGDSAGRVVGFDRSGRTTWTMRMDSKIMGAPEFDKNGVMYASSWFGKVFAIRPGQNTPQWSMDLGGLSCSKPRLSEDGRLYVNIVGNSLVSLSLPGSAPPEPPPLDLSQNSAPPESKPTIQTVEDWVLVGNVKLPVRKA